MIYGSDQHTLDYFDVVTPQNILQVPCYGPVTRMLMGSDNHSFLAITENGIILRFSIFGSTKK